MARPLRIIEGTSAEVEEQVAGLWDKYAVLSFTVSSLTDRVVVTAIMIDKRELPRPAAMVSMPGGGRPPFGS